jgi:hypothetical protein
MEIGVGNTAGDTAAYLAADMQAYWLLHVPSDSSERRELVERLKTTPQHVQVVSDWAQVRSGVLEGKRYPPAQALRRLGS